MSPETRSGRECPRLSKCTQLEPALTAQEPLPKTTARRMVFHRAFSKLRKAVWTELRTGYQDETGFHSGIKPAEKEIHWPPVW